MTITITLGAEFIAAISTGLILVVASWRRSALGLRRLGRRG